MTDAALEKLVAALRAKRPVRLDASTREWLIIWLGGGSRSHRNHLEAALGVAGDDLAMVVTAYHSLDRVLFVDGRLDLEAAGLDGNRGKVGARRRYRQLIKVFHPDRFPELAAWLTPRCQAIHDAYARFKRGEADASAGPARSPAGPRRQDTHRRPPPGAGHWFRDPGPIWPALVARWRASLGRVHNLQQKVLVLVAVVALLPVLHLYLAANGQDTASSPEVVRPEPVAVDDGSSRVDTSTADLGPVAMEPPAPPWWYNGGGLENLETGKARAAAAIEPDTMSEDQGLVDTGRKEEHATPGDHARIPATPLKVAISAPESGSGSAGMDSPGVHLSMLERWLVSLEVIPRSEMPSDWLSSSGTAITWVNNASGESAETSPSSESVEPASGEPEAGVGSAGDSAPSAPAASAASVNGEDKAATVARSDNASPLPDRVKDSPDASAVSNAEAAAQTRSKILALLEGYRRSIERGDLEGFMDHFTRDPRENRNHGRQWFSENYGNLFRKTAWRRFKLEVEDVEPEGSAWVARAHYELQIAYPDDRRRESSGSTRYTIVRDEGRWRIRAIDH